jgi:hypothetical protein
MDGSKRVELELVAVAMVAKFVWTNVSSYVCQECGYHKNLFLRGHRFMYSNETQPNDLLLYFRFALDRAHLQS